LRPTTPPSHHDGNSIQRFCRAVRLAASGSQPPRPFRLALVADDDHVRRDRYLRSPQFPGPPNRALRRALSYPPRTITGGSVALLLGPWQFSTKLRERALNLHRRLGRIYLAAVALGSLAGFTLAFFSVKGPPTHFGFGALAVLWFASGLTAYRRILRGNIESHRQWMVRNYALTLAAVTLRNELPLLLVARMQFSHAYVIVSWLCSVPNLLVAEWLLRRQASQVKHVSSSRVS